MSCQQQYDTLLALIRHQTVAALHWVPESKDSSTMKDNTVSLAIVASGTLHGIIVLVMIL